MKTLNRKWYKKLLWCLPQFLLGKVIIGILGAIAPLAIIYAIYNPVMDLLRDVLLVMVFDIRPQEYVLAMLAPLLVIVGVMIGILGSAISIRRHLNV